MSWTDGSWFDSARKLFNAQTLRIYGQEGSETRRGPGVVIHTTAPAPRSGAPLTPHLAHYETATDAEYLFENIPANDVPPKIRASAVETGCQDTAKRRTLLRGPAPQHAAPRTTELPTKRNVQGPP